MLLVERMPACYWSLSGQRTHLLRSDLWYGAHPWLTWMIWGIVQVLPGFARVLSLTVVFLTGGAWAVGDGRIGRTGFPMRTAPTAQEGEPMLLP
jgi:hypothetical protein